jgi:hypothetical protein
LRWGRGFFRAWIVISVLWVGLAVIVAKPQTYPRLWHKATYEIETPSGPRFTLDTSMTRDRLEQVLDSELRREEERSGTNAESSARDSILKEVDAEYRTQDQALQAWLITIIPPVALLILGIAVGWVIGGFREDLGS